MSGTKAGGLKAAMTNKKLYGNDFYRQIGKKGGQNGHTGGFAANPELARIAGRKGGSISRRGLAKCPYDSYCSSWKKVKPAAMNWYEQGFTLRAISNRVGLPCSVLRYYMKKELNYA